MIVLWIILALCLLAMVGSYLVFRIACVRGHEYPWEDNDALRKKIGPSYAALVKDGVDWLRQQQPRDLYLTSYDGLRLHARPALQHLLRVRHLPPPPPVSVLHQGGKQ